MRDYLFKRMKLGHGQGKWRKTIWGLLWLWYQWVQSKESVFLPWHFLTSAYHAYTLARTWCLEICSIPGSLRSMPPSSILCSWVYPWITHHGWNLRRRSNLFWRGENWPGHRDGEEPSRRRGTSSNYHLCPKSKRTLKYKGQIGNIPICAMIDSGSTHSCINPSINKKISLKTFKTTPLTVRIANGEKMCTY